MQPILHNTSPHQGRKLLCNTMRRRRGESVRVTATSLSQARMGPPPSGFVVSPQTKGVPSVVSYKVPHPRGLSFPPKLKEFPRLCLIRGRGKARGRCGGGRGPRPCRCVCHVWGLPLGTYGSGSLAAPSHSKSLPLREFQGPAFIIMGTFPEPSSSLCWPSILPHCS
jgi:hypothetical protein